MNDRKNDLKLKKEELEDIVSETRKEEEELQARSKVAEVKVEGRLLHAYSRVRQNFRNGLAVVPVERDACGGCFNKIPPQRHLDIRTHKKIIVCEHCGRILVDADFLLGNVKPEVPVVAAKKTARKKQQMQKNKIVFRIAKKSRKERETFFVLKIYNHTLLLHSQLLKCYLQD